MHILVTGGAGFIGSNIVEELIRQGHQVRVLDNFLTGHRVNLSGQNGLAEIIDGDVRLYHVVRAAVEGMEVILHEAALPSVPRSVKDPISSNDINVCGTLNVLHAAKEAKVKRVVYASSSSIYGDNPDLPKHELMVPNPLSPYAVSKLAAEHYCKVFWGMYGLPTVALRYFNVFGPRQDPTSQYSAVIPKFIQAMLSGLSPTIYGDGEQTRDFTYVSNVVDANILAATVECTFGGAMNCAGHDRISLNRLVTEINSILGTSLVPKYESARPGDIKHSFAAIEKAEKEIGYSPGVPFQLGLAKTVEWYARNTKR